MQSLTYCKDHAVRSITPPLVPYKNVGDPEVRWDGQVTLVGAVCCEQANRYKRQYLNICI